TVLTDAFGRQLSAEQAIKDMATQGRDVTLTIRRDLQFLAEQTLAESVEKYQAKGGEIIILDPTTGDILALAAWPQFEQSQYHSSDQAHFPNPSLTSLYEPGSTLKILTVAAAIDAGAITPDTQCPNCAAARRYGKYTIRTWNDVYHPNITMTEALAKSDNTAMIYAAEQLGAEQFRSYLKKFGIGSRINIDLQGDRDTPFPERWGSVELATISFGQGVSTTSLQLIKAVGAIANDGFLMRPRIVKGVFDPSTNEYTESKKTTEAQVVAAETARAVTQMLVVSAQQGEAQWIQSPTHTVAGKTGTSQIATAGGYDSSKTIASYIGYAPPTDPKFVMLVKFTEPGSSPWAAETAAPVWYDMAQDLFISLNIPPDRQPRNEQDGV
ncbi:MAG: penicillin-binding protein 2, partial [Patescibacteria group bacterium]